jgi:hypothetical protein
MTIEAEPRLTPRDFEIEKMRQFISGYKVDDIELYRIQRMVFFGINLRIRKGLEVRPSAEMSIIEEISRSMYLASGLLNQPPADRVEFLTGAEGGIPNEENGGIYTDTANFVSQEFPNGVYKYSPNTLKRIAECIEGTGDLTYLNVVYLLAHFTAHEAFHVYQSHHYPDGYKKDAEIFESQLSREEKNKRWCKTISEKTAYAFGRMFASAYIQSMMENI